MRIPPVISGLALGMVLASTAPAATLEQTLARMDQSAASFRSMSAKVRNLAHTAVINEDSVDSGTMRLKRSKQQLLMLIDLVEPDPKTVAFQGRKVEVYFPKIKTVQEYDIGKNRALVEQFLLLGWGTSGKEIAAGYAIKPMDEETISGQKADRLELIPKAPEVLKHVRKLELWIGPAGYPLQQKLYFPAGDYKLVTYSEMKINPDLPDSALRLNLPKGVTREYPQK